MTRITCQAIVCVHNNNKLCMMESIKLYTGKQVRCHHCDELIFHDLVDCANFRPKPNFEYMEESQ